jgi:S-adenosylmethionine hydrolase
MGDPAGPEPMGDPAGPEGVTEAPPAIFFLSDYGTEDEFVGVVHAVLHRLAPSVTVVDVAHRIPPFDVVAGAALLVRAGPHLGPGVVLAVVDPGVGTDRRGVALELAPGGPTWLVGPDNGLLLPFARSRGGVRSAVALDPDRLGGAATAHTFDGRDVFGPAAAHLARGGEATAIGTPVDPGTLVAAPQPAGEGAPIRPTGAPARDRSALAATVTWIDRFGNVQLDLAPVDLAAIGLVPGGTARITVGADSADRALTGRWVGAFAELGPGEWGLLEDANGRMALVLDRRSAALDLGLAGPGTTVGIARLPGAAVG